MSEAAKSSNKRPESRAMSSGAGGKIIHTFFKTLGEKEDAKILDIGLLSSENIAFFAKQVKQLYLCDFIRRLDLIYRKDLSFDTLLKDFDYPPLTFDGILLWNYCDHLTVDEVGKFVKQCYMMVKPEGLIMVYAIGERQVSPMANAFTVDEDYNVHMRPLHKLMLPSKYRPNRKILELFSLFTPVKSYIYRNGFRGYIFQRN